MADDDALVMHQQCFLSIEMQTILANDSLKKNWTYDK